DLGAARVLGHRFFFALDEVEPTDEDEAAVRTLPWLLVAGIGNVFLGDDGFGVAAAGRLADRALPDGVDVRDFGIRGMDLAYALQDPYEVVVFLDAAPRGERAGAVSLIGPELELDEVGPGTRRMGRVV